ncbi:MAG: isochorismatase family cysteine hydrolase [Tissierellia bacterium]|nr:isochorismatase family cysteine hydrolase [Tissierellia bacterium]
MDVLIVVDMQKDFIYGSLATKEGQSVVHYVVEEVKKFQGEIIYTLDTHGEDYKETQEGKYLPIPHCIKGTEGHELVEPLKTLQVEKNIKVFEKNTFGSLDLANYLVDLNHREGIDSIRIMGVCTDICVISNALLLKAHLTEVPIFVDPKGSAGVTPEKHKAAIDVLQSCQVQII